MTARPIPLWDFGTPAAAPLGLPMCQNRAAIPTWSYAMERVPPALIVEIGTYAGGFTTAIAMHAYMIGCAIVSVDRMDPDERLVGIAQALGVRFVKGDEFGASVASIVRAEISRARRRGGRIYILCDGGDKPRELALWAGELESGDVIAAHDYVPDDGPQGDQVYWPCGEIKAEHGARAAAAHDLEPWMQDHFDLAAWLVYRKR